MRLAFDRLEFDANYALFIALTRYYSNGYDYPIEIIHYLLDNGANPYANGYFKYDHIEYDSPIDYAQKIIIEYFENDHDHDQVFGMLKVNRLASQVSEITI